MKKCVIVKPQQFPILGKKGNLLGNFLLGGSVLVLQSSSSATK